jgi:hypothetical protein
MLILYIVGFVKYKKNSKGDRTVLLLLLKTMSDITAVVATASDVFNLIAHTPNNVVFQPLNELLVVCCLYVILTGTDVGCPIRGSPPRHRLPYIPLVLL